MKTTFFNNIFCLKHLRLVGLSYNEQLVNKNIPEGHLEQLN